MDEAAIETWFMRRGLPHAAPNFTATADVWTRAWPFLVVVLFLETFTIFDDDVAGWNQALRLLIGVAITVAAFALFNRIRGWDWFGLPDRIGAVELAFFVFAPVIISILVVGVDATRVTTLIAVNLVILGLSYVVISYGLLPAMRVGLLQAVGQLRTVVQLVARSLPMLLIITAFIFLNAEMWQVASELPNSYLVLILIGFFTMAVGFLLLQVPRETDQLARFASWDECVEIARRSGAPMDVTADDLTGVPPPPDLPRVERANVAVALTISQTVQATLVGIITATFYLAFGLLAVRRETLTQWTTNDSIEPIATLDFLGSQIIVTREHFAVAAFVGAFSLLQFAVSSVIDSSYRDQFHDEVARDVREVLAVRAISRTLFGTNAS
ncbi:hypothetical protein [Ilumatobacter sp.]|uniref:hypothetical protein n=1 Tax=Ilumatobacter sp. TaxID=1967498 RepID=UPI003AF90B92